MSDDGMAVIDAALSDIAVVKPTLAGAAGKRCRRHEWGADWRFTCSPNCSDMNAHLARLHQVREVFCSRCGAIRNEESA